MEHTPILPDRRTAQHADPPGAPPPRRAAGFFVAPAADYSSSVNRSPRWLLPTVLIALVLAVIVGAALS
jgi:hypothetical protein